MNNLPTVIFTNFWQADANLGKLNYIADGNSKVLQDIKLFSIALGMPPPDKIPNLVSAGITRLDMFCPTKELFRKYKADNDWDYYHITYRNILRSRKQEIETWLNGLDNNCNYVLCCWEDTSKNCHCHRQLLFDAFKSTKIWKDKASWVYKHGNEKL